MARLPLSTLLSHALVAFIVEFDNEFEHRTPHRTTNHGATPGGSDAPWLVSFAMWCKFLRFVPEGGISVREWQSLTGLSKPEARQWLERLGKWHGYLAIESQPPSYRIHATPGGRAALDSWKPLAALIETRWQQRFGIAAIDQLRASLAALTAHLDPALPDCPTILGYGLFSVQPKPTTKQSPAPQPIHASQLPLWALLSKPLLAFAIAFERESNVSLAICANLFPFAGKTGVHVRDLPRLAGISKEAVATSVNFLVKRGYATIQTDPLQGRARLLKLTPKGQSARNTYEELIRSIEDRWRALFGNQIVDAVRTAMEQLESEATSPSPWFQGLTPYPDGWRAALPTPGVLPAFPLILHRGGFPDGS